jgi:hypothetical protein
MSTTTSWDQGSWKREASRSATVCLLRVCSSSSSASSQCLLESSLSTYASPGLYISCYPSFIICISMKNLANSVLWQSWRALLHLGRQVIDWIILAVRELLSDPSRLDLIFMYISFEFLNLCYIWILFLSYFWSCTYCFRFWSITSNGKH